MTLRRLLPLLALAACQDTGACHLALLASVPFDVEHNHLIVQARINDHPSRLIFDTGAQTSLLSDDAVDRLGLQNERPVAGYVRGIGGGRGVSVVSAYSFAIQNLHGHNFGFLAGGIFGHRTSRYDGFLSTDILSRYDIDFDVAAHRIGFYEPSGDCSRPTVALAGDVVAVPLLHEDETDSRPRIDISIDGQTFRALLDTGADRSVLFREAAARLGLSATASPSDRVAHIGGIGAEPVAVYRHVLQTVRIGDIAVTNMPIAIADASGPGEDTVVLGLDFIAKVHLWLSNSSGRVVINYPPLPSPVDARPH